VRADAKSIQPAYVSEVAYRSCTCQQLGEEKLRALSGRPTASIQLINARSNIE